MSEVQGDIGQESMEEGERRNLVQGSRAQGSGAQENSTEESVNEGECG